MKLSQLEELGGFVGDETTKKTIVWKHKGKTHTFDVLIKRSSYGEIEQRMLATDDKAKGAITISQSVVLADTAEQMPYEKAFALKPSLASLLLKAILEVNEEEEEAAAKK